MITIYKSTENGIEQISNAVDNCWINIVNPSPTELSDLRNLKLPQDFLTYPLDMDERPRSEREDDGTLLVIIRIPVYEGETADVPYTTIPLGIIISDEHILTICSQECDILSAMALGKVRGLSTGKRFRFILRFLLGVATKYLNFLREINKSTELLEDKLQHSVKNKEVQELLKYQKSLVYFTTALRANELLLERLQRMQLFKQYPEDEDLLEDVITENQQAIEMTDISSNILSSMMGAFASIISNNLNVILKFLASITIVLSIPTIVTSFFGMNVNLPFSDHPMAYLIIIAMFMGISFIVIYIFMKRDWF
jgi:magnesium transporter